MKTRFCYFHNLIRLILICIFSFPVTGWGQDPANKEHLIYRDYQPGYYQRVILKSLDENAESNSGKKRQVLGLDLLTGDYPDKPTDYGLLWHNPPVSQGRTGTCWCFAATSLFESEIKRMNGKEVKLSEMFFVYWEYVERSIEFVRRGGDVYFAEGSESNALIRLMKKYGAMPLAAYPGKPGSQEFHDHSKLIVEMKSYLDESIKANIRDEAAIISNIRSILNFYLGEPPDEFTVDGIIYTPNGYLDYLKIRPDDYFSFMSTRSIAYNQRGELVEPDNWWHGDNYYNVKLDDFLWIIKNALMNGYTACVCGDVSEPGHIRSSDISLIPSFDLPEGSIDEESREFRMYNGTTTDDHCLHFIGLTERGGYTWFAVKDSGAGGFDGPSVGYHFFREDYFKLKMMNILVEKNAARKVLDKIIK